MFKFYATDEIHNSKSQKFWICDLRHWRDGNKEYKTLWVWTELWFSGRLEETTRQAMYVLRCFRATIVAVEK